MIRILKIKRDRWYQLWDIQISFLQLVITIQKIKIVFSVEALITDLRSVGKDPKGGKTAPAVTGSAEMAFRYSTEVRRSLRRLKQQYQELGLLPMPPPPPEPEDQPGQDPPPKPTSKAAAPPKSTAKDAAGQKQEEEPPQPRARRPGSPYQVSGVIYPESDVTIYGLTEICANYMAVRDRQKGMIALGIGSSHVEDKKPKQKNKK